MKFPTRFGLAGVSTSQRSGLIWVNSADKDATTLTASRPSGVRPSDGAFKCGLCCRRKTGFGACLLRCMEDGQCCDSGETGRNCQAP
jgi:hypothetical protein